METILKWFRNKKQGDTNELISRTLLKISVISRYRTSDNDISPNFGELWRCRIIKEMGSGTSRGCFIVEPLERVDEHQILHITTGMFYKKLINNRLIITPKQEWSGHSCILPLQHKHMMAEAYGAYAVIVVLGTSEEELLELELENKKAKKDLQQEILDLDAKSE